MGRGNQMRIKLKTGNALTFDDFTNQNKLEVRLLVLRVLWLMSPDSASHQWHFSTIHPVLPATQRRSKLQSPPAAFSSSSTFL